MPSTFSDPARLPDSSQVWRLRGAEALDGADRELTPNTVVRSLVRCLTPRHWPSLLRLHGSLHAVCAWMAPRMQKEGSWAETFVQTIPLIPAPASSHAIGGHLFWAQVRQFFSEQCLLLAARLPTPLWDTGQQE